MNSSSPASPKRIISAYDKEPNFDEVDACEADAIANYDYEKAQYLYETRLAMNVTDVNDQQNHYQEQLENYTNHYNEILNQTKEHNQQQYEKDCEEAKQRLQQRLEELVAQQQAEMDALQEKWKEARENEKEHVEKNVQTLLSSSQLLAKSHRYTEAIAMRDKAMTIKKHVRQPEIDQCDSDFRNQFDQMYERHEKAIKELIAQHEALIQLFNEKLEANNKTAEANYRIEDAYASVEIMDTVLEQSKNPSATIAVVQHFSPRKSQKLNKSLRNSTGFDSPSKHSEK